MNRKNQQVQISSQQEEGNSNSFYFYTSNAATGSNKGAEFDSKVKLLSGLVLRMSCGILETHIDAYEFWTDDTTNTVLGGREQAMAPMYNFAIGMKYTHSSGLYADVEYTGKDAYYYSDSHNQKSEAYQILNLTTGYSKGFWSLSFWGKNIFDSLYTTRGFYFGNEPIWNEEKEDHEYPDKLYCSFGDPFEYGVSLKYHF
jgi:outer membrane receptor protein involved in Fe transport